MTRGPEIEPYRGRALDLTRPALVYRNLMRTDAVWYSVMQAGLVVGHARRLAVAGATFVVREGGRLRALESGVRNVHAFVRGCVEAWRDVLAPGETGTLALVRYRPASGFAIASGERVTSARVASLDERACWAVDPVIAARPTLGRD